MQLAVVTVLGWPSCLVLNGRLKYPWRRRVARDVIAEAWVAP